MRQLVTSFWICCFDSFITRSFFFVTVAGTEKPSVVTKMIVTLSADHRVFDGQVGGNREYSLHSLVSTFYTVCSPLIHTHCFFTILVLFQLLFCLNCVQTLRMFEDFSFEKGSAVQQMNPWMITT